jgi:hypothetical protein
VFAVLGEARRAVHLRLTSNPETVPGQKSASGKVGMLGNEKRLSAKPGNTFIPNFKLAQMGLCLGHSPVTFLFGLMAVAHAGRLSYDDLVIIWAKATSLRQGLSGPVRR